ncbi:acyl-CoA synthetase [Mycobacterium sp. URHB0044]|uniref:acyl-CoA synthetase n=1 Tax=Mycobacterium sp. URHB0044 TaxID=1380386 RepID=UPI000491532F|nr:acyl-CoA synthetase [Mycobacterium sp. URHB0044]
MASDAGFNLSAVVDTVARAVPDQDVLVWRDRRFTYREMNTRVDGVAHYLVQRGLGCHTERAGLAGHLSGQDHVGLYLRNCNQYLESMVAGFRARVAPFNVNYRYVEVELLYLLRDAQTKALVYHAEFAPWVAAIRDRLPELGVLIQVSDDSGNELLSGAVDYDAIVGTTAPAAGMPTPTGDDLFILYTGGTTGMPKGVLWRQDDVFITSMGGTPYGTSNPMTSYAEIAASAVNAKGGVSMLMVPPFMHGAAQWSAFHMITLGGKVVLLDNVEHFDPADALTLAIREKVISIPIVGDAVARPLLDEIRRGTYDLSGLTAINNGSAPLTPGVRAQLLDAVPHIVVTDVAGASETGLQMSTMSIKGMEADTATFTPVPTTTVVDEQFTRTMGPGEGSGWLAQRGRVPIGYLGDPDKTARTFPVIDGVRYAIPGDRAELLEDGRIVLLGRDSVTINSGGEKIFVEEVERAIAAHPAVRDVVVVGRPSERWGSEAVAVVQIAEGVSVSDEDLLAECGRHVARYKVPKAIVRCARVERSPSGKADYRWAQTRAIG